MSQNELKVQSRATTGKSAAKKMRVQGMVPAVAYGHKEEPVKLSVNARELRDLMAHHGARGLLMLKYEGGSTPDVPVIIKSLQRHPYKPYVNSVDFLRVSLNETVTASVPLVLHGEPDSVRVEGGVLVQAMHEMQVSAFPQNLPESIIVDVSGLEFNGAPIHIKEITMPEGVTALTDGEEPVAVVNPPEPEELPEPVVAEDAPTQAGAQATQDAAESVPADKG